MRQSVCAAVRPDRQRHLRWYSSARSQPHGATGRRAGLHLSHWQQSYPELTPVRFPSCPWHRVAGPSSECSAPMPRPPASCRHGTTPPRGSPLSRWCSVLQYRQQQYYCHRARVRSYHRLSTRRSVRPVSGCGCGHGRQPLRHVPRSAASSPAVRWCTGSSWCTYRPGPQPSSEPYSRWPPPASWRSGHCRPGR